MKPRRLLRALAPAACALALALPRAPQDIGGAAAGPPPPSRERFPDWDARDAEGRWALIAADLERDVDLKGWAPFLAAEGALAELEWLAVTEVWAGAPALEALVTADAPGWLRAAAWRCECADSHSLGDSKVRLRGQPEVFLAWAQRHEQALTPAVRALRDEVARVRLDALAGGAALAARYAPPLTDGEVFGALFATGEAVPFGARLSAEQGVVYEQQVERAVHALQASSRRSSESLAALLGLAHHPSERLALAGLLAFTHLLPDEVPDVDLAALARDPELAAPRRGAAFMASTYGYAPRAFLWLHDAAGMPRDEHWSAAVDRLAEVGNGYTLQLLEQRYPTAGAGSLGAEQRRELDAALADLRERARVQEREVALSVGPMLELPAYAAAVESTIAPGLARWTLATLRAHAGRTEIRAELQRLRDGYEPGAEAGAQAEELRQRVRSYAAELLR